MSFATPFLVTSTLVLAFAATCPGSASRPKGTVTIDNRVQSAIQGFPGAVSLYAKNLDTGASYEPRADAPVPTASTIVSDNTATNLILDRIGRNAVNRRMAQLVLTQTAVMRKIMQTKPESLTDEVRKPGVRAS